MGYYTQYRISVSESAVLSDIDQKELTNLELLQKRTKSEKVKEELDKAIKTLKGQLIMSPEELIADKIGYNPFEEDCKWYDHDKEMKEISTEHPDVLFTLEGTGESNEDMWITYYKNGKSQESRAHITFDPFDESKLS